MTRTLITRLGAAFLIASCISWANASFAQYPYAYPFGYSRPHASTAGEGYARGWADLVRSSGYANLLNSEASINYEAARSAALENRRKYTETYFETRRMNREYREAANPPMSTEELFRTAKASLPAHLSPSELDPLTGEINWPPLLTTDLFAEQRQELENVFSARSHGEVSYQYYQRARAAIDSMVAKLQNLLGSVPAQDYAEAHGFLNSLNYEGQLPVNRESFSRLNR